MMAADGPSHAQHSQMMWCQIAVTKIARQAGCRTTTFTTLEGCSVSSASTQLHATPANSYAIVMVTHEQQGHADSPFGPTDGLGGSNCCCSELQKLRRTTLGWVRQVT
jgi:hypothetical protein